MPSAGPEMKTVTAAVATLPALLLMKPSSRLGAGRLVCGAGLAWGEAGGDVPAVLKVSQQHIRLGSRGLQLPHGHGVAPPQEAGEAGRGEHVGLRGGASPWEGTGEPGSAGPRQGVGGGCFSLGHEGVGAALVGAVRLALCWQQLFGVRKGHTRYKPQGCQAAELGTGSGTMRQEGNGVVPTPSHISCLPGQTLRLEFGGVS